MNREEEIKQAIKDICSCEFCKFDKDYCPFCKERNVTVDAINWADQHPREGLWDAEKLCAFIEDNVDSYLFFNNDWNAVQFKCEKFIEDLRKAMEETMKDKENTGITALDSFDAIMTVIDRHRPFEPSDFEKETFIPDL